jgi:hypothetical protein
MSESLTALVLGIAAVAGLIGYIIGYVAGVSNREIKEYKEPRAKGPH